jgi:hypothetical protein
MMRDKEQNFDTDESDAGTHRTPKALRAKCIRRHIYCLATALGVRARPRVAFVFKHA